MQKERKRAAPGKELKHLDQLTTENPPSREKIIQAFDRAPFIVYHAFEWRFEEDRGIKNTPNNNLVLIPNESAVLKFPNPEAPTSGMILRASDLFDALGLRPADVVNAYSRQMFKERSQLSLELDKHLPPVDWNGLRGLELPDNDYYFSPKGGQVLADILDKRISFVTKPMWQTDASRHLVVPRKEVQQFFEEAQRQFEKFLQTATKSEHKFIKGYQRVMDLGSTYESWSRMGSSDETRALNRKIGYIEDSIEQHIPSAIRRREIIRLIAQTRPQNMDLGYYYQMITNPEAFFKTDEQADVEGNVTLFTDPKDYIRIYESDPAEPKIPWRVRKSFKRWFGYFLRGVSRYWADQGAWIDPKRLLVVKASKSRGGKLRTTREYYKFNPNNKDGKYRERFKRGGIEISIFEGEEGKIDVEKSGNSVSLDREKNDISLGTLTPYGFMQISWENGTLTNVKLDDKAIFGSREERTRRLLPRKVSTRAKNFAFQVESDDGKATVRIPVRVQAQEIASKLVHGDILRDPFNAEPQYDSTWKDADFKKALGIKIT